MTIKLDENQTMYNAVVAFFESEFPDQNGLPEILQPSVARFKAEVEAFHNKAIIQRESRLGDTFRKSAQRKMISRDGATLSKLLQSYARKASNIALKENMGYRKWSLQQLKESDLLYQCSEIYKTALIHREALEPLGLSPATLDNIGQNLETFRTLVVGTRQAVVEKTSLGERMGEIHDEAADILRNQVDPLVDLFLEKYPLWVKSYYRTRMVIRQLGSKAKIRGTVVESGTTRGVKNLVVNLVGENISRRTQTGGVFSFRRLEPGTYTLAVSGAGYADTELASVIVAPGLTTRVAIELARA